MGIGRVRLMAALAATPALAGDSNVEWAFNGGMTLTHFTTTQSIERVANKSALETYCATHKCTKLKTVLAGAPAELNSARLSASGTATVAENTDLTLGGDFY